MGLNKEAFNAWLDSDGEIEFDIYAQNPNHWQALSDRIPGLIVASAGGLYPFQAEGLLQGYPFYFRAEWGYADLKVGAKYGEKPYLGQNTLYSASVHGVEDLVDDQVHFEELMLMLVPDLAKSLYIWEFPCKKIKFTDKGDLSYTVSDEPDIKVGWGHTPAEGYLASQQPHEFLVEKGWSVEFQRQLWLDAQVSPIPSNSDDREYPAVMPAFQVLL